MSTATTTLAFILIDSSKWGMHRKSATTRSGKLAKRISRFFLTKGAGFVPPTRWVFNIISVIIFIQTRSLVYRSAPSIQRALFWFPLSMLGAPKCVSDSVLILEEGLCSRVSEGWSQAFCYWIMNTSVSMFNYHLFLSGREFWFWEFFAWPLLKTAMQKKGSHTHIFDQAKVGRIP